MIHIAFTRQLLFLGLGHGLGFFVFVSIFVGGIVIAFGVRPKQSRDFLTFQITVFFIVREVVVVVVIIVGESNTPLSSRAG